MKAKLLKKVRKRFTITHMPNGFVGCDGDRYEYNLFRLKDSTNRFFDDYVQLMHKPGSQTQFCKDSRIFQTEKECIYYLKQVIIRRLRSDGYIGRKDVLMKKQFKKVY